MKLFFDTSAGRLFGEHLTRVLHREGEKVARKFVQAVRTVGSIY